MRYENDLRFEGGTTHIRLHTEDPGTDPERASQGQLMDGTGVPWEQSHTYTWTHSTPGEYLITPGDFIVGDFIVRQNGVTVWSGIVEPDDPRLEPVDIIDRIDQLVNDQLDRGRKGDLR